MYFLTLDTESHEKFSQSLENTINTKSK